MTSAPPPSADREGWRHVGRLMGGGLGRLITGQSLGQAGDALTQVGLAQFVLFEVGEGATPGAVAAVLAVVLLPFALVGPVAAVTIDRWDRRRVLVITAGLRVAVAGGAWWAATLGSTWAAYASVLAILSLSRFVLAAKGSALPVTVAGHSLVTANSLSSLVGVAAATTGAGLGALLAVGSGSVPVMVALAAYLGSTLAFARLPPVGGGLRTHSLRSDLGRAAREVAAGARFIATHASVRVPLLAVWGHRLLLGVGFVILVLLGDSAYGLEVSGFAVAVAAAGAAAVAGTALAPLASARAGPRTIATGAFATGCAASGAAAVASATLATGPLQFSALLLGLALVSAAFQVLKMTADSAVQRGTPDGLRGRVFVVYDIGYNAAFVLAGLALIPLWREDGAPALGAALAVAFALGALLVLRFWSADPSGARDTRSSR